MPPVPPMPSVRWGMRGSTPPMGMRQYSSSSMPFTVTPRRLSRTWCSGVRISVCLA